LLQVRSLAEHDQGIDLLEEVAFLVGARKRSEEIERALSAIDASPLVSRLPQLQIGLVVHLLSGDPQRLSPSALRMVARLSAVARRLAPDENAAPRRRAEAIKLIAFAIDSHAIDLLTPLLDTRQPRDVQLAAVRALSRSADNEVAVLLIDKWSSATPVIRDEIVEALASKSHWVSFLLDAVRRKRIPAGEISAARRNRLLTHPESAISERAAELLADEVLGERNDVIESFKAALALSSDADRGQAVFLRECIACHRFGDKGHDVGPNLSDYGRKRLPAEALMAQILDPNREVSSDFVNYNILLENGRIVTGIIAAQTPTSITLKRDQNINATALRKEIEEIKSSGKSLMPEGLEKKITLQEMADLLEFLNAVNQRV